MVLDLDHLDCPRRACQGRLGNRLRAPSPNCMERYRITLRLSRKHPLRADDFHQAVASIITSLPSTRK
jgi:hypothetical protein